MRLLLTAGPTWEPIDPVRYLGNRSSGRLGLAIAREAARRGHPTTLLAGSGVAGDHHDRPDTFHVEHYESSRDLQALLETQFPLCDALIMAAAVADYRPAHPSPTKFPRTPTGLTLELEATPDLVAALARTRRPDQRVIAFALEQPEDLEARGQSKLRRKHVDALVANPIETIASDEIDPLWLTPDAEPLRPGRMSKSAFAAWLLDRLDAMFHVEQ